MNRVALLGRTSAPRRFAGPAPRRLLRQTVMMCLLLTMMPMGRVEVHHAGSPASMAGVSTMMRCSRLLSDTGGSLVQAARRKDGSTPGLAATVFQLVLAG